MDVVNFTNALENHSAGLPLTAECRTKSCPLCCTLNHSLSLECFNCGWRGVFCSAEAAGPDLFSHQTPLLVKAPSLGARWRTLKNWLFFIGRHRYNDPQK